MNYKPQRKRTFTGCKTCRIRHLKYDNARPECGPCRQVNRVCGGYWSPLLWITEGITGRSKDQSQKGFEFRYPMLSEEQRQHMATEMTESLGHRSAPELIAQLDATCYNFEVKERSIQGLVEGPFGAFSINSEIDSAPSPVIDLSHFDNIEPAIDQSVSSQNIDNQAEWTNIPSDLYTSDACHSVQFVDSAVDLDQIADNDHGFGNVLDSGMAEIFFESSATDYLALLDSELPLCESLNHDANEKVDGACNSLLRSRSSSLSIVAPDLVPANETILPVHSEPLLRHYRQQIQEVHSDQAESASPWKLIFFPCALETFAELSLWRNTSRTRFSLLYCLLSLSASHLHRVGDSDFRGESWQRIAVQYQRVAQVHLRAAIKDEMSGVGQTKYKELLVAILAISMVSLSRRSDSYQVFLLDAERLIRRQGLDGEIPFDKRLLHHMYSHLRVLSESIGARLVLKIRIFIDLIY